MTQKESIAVAIEWAKEKNAQEVLGKLEEIYTALNKKSAKKQSPEDKELFEKAKEFLVGKGQIRCNTVADHLKVSQSKASSILNKLATQQEIKREKVGKITYFSI